MASLCEFTRHRHMRTVLTTRLWLECSSFTDAAGPIAAAVRVFFLIFDELTFILCFPTVIIKLITNEKEYLIARHAQ